MNSELTAGTFERMSGIIRKEEVTKAKRRPSAAILRSANHSSGSSWTKPGLKLATCAIDQRIFRRGHPSMGRPVQELQTQTLALRFRK